MLRRRRRVSQSGVTLIEMLVVVTLMALMAALAMPSMTSGLESLRINGAASDTVVFLNRALNRAQREQKVMEVSIRQPERTLVLQSMAPGIMDQLTMPDGVTIANVFPALPNGQTAPVRQFLLLPGGTVPRMGIELVNQRGQRRLVRIDPITGVPQIEKGAATVNADENAGPLHGGSDVPASKGGGDVLHSAGEEPAKP